MTDDRPLEPDPQIQDDLNNWGVPPVQPRPIGDYFPNDAPISNEEVPPAKQQNVVRTNLLLLALLVACAPTTVSPGDVRITSDPAVPVRCTLLGEVTGGGNTLAGVGTSTGTTAVEASAPQDPIEGLRQATADFGGDTVVVTTSGDSVAGSSITGDAYKCRGYNPQ